MYETRPPIQASPVVNQQDAPRGFTAGSDSSTQSEIITVAEVAAILKCRPSSVYNLTRKRAKRYKHTPLPVIRLPLGLRFKRSSVIKWLDSLESTGAIAP